MITHTEAIIFKSVDYSESSKIVTVFSREHGKIGMMARGVKKPKSKLSGLIEVGNLLDVVYYYKSSRSVQILTEATYAEKTLNLRTDFVKMATMTSAIELITQLLHDNEVNLPLFDFTRTMLLWLNETDIHPPLIFPYLQVRLADIMGIGLQKEHQVTENSANYLNLKSGYISRENDSSHSYKLSSNQQKFIEIALQSQSSILFDIPFEQGELKELIKNLDRYLKYHIEGLRDRKSDAIFEQILQE